ncbi:MAG TPA: SAF domain-containing protein [Pseudonocardiaceae bacterium]|jgi:Flp pilus assembly protein CpaB|nr:SAF domain-containing protein [Pseudonocardiaceae bacterium]
MPAIRKTAITPLLTDRLRGLLGARGWPRALALRRAFAVLLVMLACALVLRPAAAHDGPAGHVVVTTHDLPAGHTLTSADVAVRTLPVGLRPSAALNSVAAAVGRVLASTVRAGEPLTDVRLLGPADTTLTAGDPRAEAVPVRLADPSVADLLRPGLRVDVITAATDHATDPVLATDATVIAVRDTGRTAGQQDRLVLLALPAASATRVAAISLRQPVTVTLR